MGNIERAVFVNAPMHDARIVVSAVDVVDVRGFIEEPSADPSERVFAINDEHLTLNSGASGQTVTDASFTRYVPSLSVISDATDIRDEVEAGVLFEGAHAYLDLMGGRLTADDKSIEQAVFTGGRTQLTQCLARQVIYTANTDASSVALTGTNGAVLRLRAGAAARVTNDPPPEYTIPHFHMYSMILKDATFVASPYATGQACVADDRGSRRGRFAIAPNSLSPKTDDFSSACSNSNYP
jgi:hypothetical protein